MSRDWDVTFSFWGAPPSNTEQDKCDNAERAIRKATAASADLSSKDIKIFVQGSYANGTNVRQDSDVDVCVLYTEAWYPDYQFTPQLSDAALGFIDGRYPYATFKDDVEAALVSHFGRSHIRRGKKALDIRENTYRVDADVVPCFEHRFYSGDLSSHSHESGTQLFPDEGGPIVDWPKQNYDNGVAKNDRTGRRFKAIARILKNLRFELIDEENKVADKIPSFLIECLVWNVPDEELRTGTLKDGVQSAIAYLWNNTRTDDICSSWTEVNDIKFLFHITQPWTRQEVNAFLQSAWDYVGFE
jgi:tRNA nucleotidyltransferase (CCA-adding enzyme)